MNTNLEATPISLTPRDLARVETTTRLIAAVMTGYMARGKSVDESLMAAERTREICLISATNLFDACSEKYADDGLEKQRLASAADLFSAAVSGLVARGEDPGRALRTAGASREHMLRTANGNVRATIETTLGGADIAKPMSSTLAAFRDSRSPNGGRGPRSNSPVL